MHCQWERKPPKLPDEDLATIISNMHRNLVKIAHVVPEMQTERQTDRQTDRQTNKQTYSLHYFATASADEVTINNCAKLQCRA